MKPKNIMSLVDTYGPIYKALKLGNTEIEQ